MLLDKQQGLAREARELHDEWLRTLGAGRVSLNMAEQVKQQTDARAAELTDALARGTISVEQHNDRRFIMVMAMRRLIDQGCDELAARMISRHPRCAGVHRRYR